MAAANIENFSVCRFVMFVFLSSVSPTEVVAGRLASAVPVWNWQKNRRVLKEVTRKGAEMTENVKGFFTQRRSGATKTGFVAPLRRCGRNLLQ
jgi:hypothetical protein